MASDHFQPLGTNIAAGTVHCQEEQRQAFQNLSSRLVRIESVVSPEETEDELVDELVFDYANSEEHVPVSERL